MTQLTDARVAIVGLGLMGGSLAASLRGRCARVVGVARRKETIDQARTRGMIHEGTMDLVTGVQGADIVVLATPVRTIITQVERIGPFLSPGCLLLDVGSTKAQIMAQMERLPAGVQPVGGHPMCGREVAGIEGAEPALYQGCTFILSPLARTSAAALALARSLVEAIGAHPLVLEPEQQDRLAATVSHLPYLLACALVSTADALTSSDPAAWEIIAGGFRDTTRIAGSDVTMMLDILLTNREEVLQALNTYQANVRRLAQLVASGEEEDLRQVLGTIRALRREMYQ